MRSFRIALSIVIACSAAGSAHGSPAPTNEPQRATLDAAALPSALSAEAHAWRVARNEEMQSRRLQRDAEIELLHARLAAGADPQEAHAIHREIARVKALADLDLLEIQARHARIAGHEDVALEIEANVAERRQRLLDAGLLPLTVAPRGE